MTTNKVIARTEAYPNLKNRNVFSQTRITNTCVESAGPPAVVTLEKINVAH